MLIKNNYYDVEIQSMGSNGEGIAKIDDLVVFVPNAVVEDKLKIKIIKVKKKYAIGKIEEIIKPSKNRVEVDCNVYNKCGGCNLLHINYEEQLKYKKQKVRDVIERIGKIKEVNINDTITMDNPLYYRNKVQFPAGEVNGKLKFGFYRKRTHDVVPVQHCVIQDKLTENITSVVESFLNENKIQPYDEKTHRGLVRHLFVRMGKKTNEIMVALVLKNGKLPNEEELVKKLLKANENIKSVLINVNREKTNKILGNKTRVIYGDEFITDYIGDVKFKISLLSFYQVNPIQTEKLYNKTLQYANLNGNETVIDAYCGIGTISLLLAKKAKKVYGIEIVEEAINDAKENAEINNINNCEFLVGKSEDIIFDLEEKGIQADVIVVDPPRKGCDEVLLQSIIKSNVKKLVYVSCDPATLARDIKILCDGGFRVNEVTPVDMFPGSTHVESVALLNKEYEALY